MCRRYLNYKLKMLKDFVFVLRSTFHFISNFQTEFREWWTGCIKQRLVFWLVACRTSRPLWRSPVIITACIPESPSEQCKRLQKGSGQLWNLTPLILSHKAVVDGFLWIILGVKSTGHFERGHVVASIDSISNNDSLIPFQGENQ